MRRYGLLFVTVIAVAGVVGVWIVASIQVVVNGL